MIKRIRHWLKKGRRGYDLAAPSRFHDTHFVKADNSDADTVIEAALETARNRCRYEVRNNTYARGIIETLANDLIGTGPRLQLKTDDIAFNRTAEQRFVTWAEHCDAAGRQDLADLLRLVMLQLCESGEAFIHVYTDPAGPAGLESLRLLAIEPDRVATPAGMIYDDKIHQGIETDAVGKPLRYYVSKHHPGSMAAGFGAALNEYDIVDADRMIHLARLDRPGQTRGMPWLTPAMDLFAQLRRYTLAVIRAAETAASVSGLLESDIPLGDGESVEEFEALEIEHDMMMTLPAGQRFNQVKAEQPVNTYDMFKREIINEIARCINMPYNVAAANSASYNYASGRLDWQVYFRSLAVIRRWLARHLLDRVLGLWLAEAVLIDPDLAAAPPVTRTLIDWVWPGAEHVDPAKEATAQDIHLKNMTTTLAAEYAKQGKDWRLEIEQIADERKALSELGIANANEGTHDTQTQPPKTDDDDDAGTGDRGRIRAVR